MGQGTPMMVAAAVLLLLILYIVYWIRGMGRSVTRSCRKYCRDDRSPSYRSEFFDEAPPKP